MGSCLAAPRPCEGVVTSPATTTNSGGAWSRKRVEVLNLRRKWESSNCWQSRAARRELKGVRRVGLPRERKRPCRRRQDLLKRGKRSTYMWVMWLQRHAAQQIQRFQQCRRFLWSRRESSTEFHPPALLSLNSVTLYGRIVPNSFFFSLSLKLIEQKRLRCRTNLMRADKRALFRSATKWWRLKEARISRNRTLLPTNNAMSHAICWINEINFKTATQV